MKSFCLTLLLLPFYSSSQEKLFDETLNALPDSVLFSTSDYEVSEIIHFTGGDLDNGHDYAMEAYSAFGDLDGDGDPEIILSGWDLGNCHAEDKSETTLKMDIHFFEANKTSTNLLDPEEFLGTSDTLGTSFLRIQDLTGDNKNDLLVMSYNECPFDPHPGKLYERVDSGFIERTIYPSVAMHEGSIVDVNLDGYPDIVGSAYTFDDESAGIDTSVYPDSLWIISDAGIPIWINDGSGNFESFVLKVDNAIERTKEENDADPPKWIPRGSAVTAADFDGDGEAELVVVDVHDGIGTSTFGTSYILIDELKYEAKHVYGRVIPLPESYFRQDMAKYGSVPGNKFPEAITHSVQVDPMDYDNDGDQDILVNVMIWTDCCNFAGVLQIYRNDGDLNFTDVTEEALYNFNIGTQVSHEMIIEDINGDGFLDIIMVDGAGIKTIPWTWGTADGGAGWEGEMFITAPRSTSNQILINTGNGKFVTAFWEGFEELLNQRQDFYEAYGTKYEPWGLKRAMAYPYILGDGTLNFIFGGEGYPNERFYFDTRAKRKFYTGPKGTLSADQGAPGYSEYYYLTEYPDVAAAVTSGEYADGLEHYLEVGKVQGYQPYAQGSHVQGSASDDVINLLSGDETASGHEGDDQINGGAGQDTAAYSDLLSGYQVTYEDTHQCTVKDIDVSNGNDGTDELQNIELLSFSDVTVKCDPGTVWRTMPGVSCRAVDPATSIKLQSRESGLTNTAENMLKIICPITLEVNDESTDISGGWKISLFAGNEGSAVSTLSCTDYRNEGFTEHSEDKPAYSTSIGAGGSANLLWNAVPAGSAASYAIACDLPSQGVIKSITVNLQ